MMVSLRLASGLIIMATTGDSSSRVHRALAVALRLGTHNPRARARARWERECPSTGVEDRCKRVELLRHRLASLRCHGERCPSQHLFPSRLQSQRIVTRQGTQLLTGALVRLQDQVHPSREGGAPKPGGGAPKPPAADSGSGAGGGDEGSGDRMVSTPSPGPGPSQVVEQT